MPFRDDESLEERGKLSVGGIFPILKHFFLFFSILLIIKLQGFLQQILNSSVFYRSNSDFINCPNIFETIEAQNYLEVWWFISMIHKYLRIKYARTYSQQFLYLFYSQYLKRRKRRNLLFASKKNSLFQLIFASNRIVGIRSSDGRCLGKNLCSRVLVPSLHSCIFPMKNR